MTELVLIAAAFATSTLTAVTGVGGGMTLIAIMPGLLPASAIVPVHAVVQLCSNSSRALFGWQHLVWTYIAAFIVGSVAGGLLAAGITRQLNLEYIPLLIATWILFSLWAPPFAFRLPSRLELFAIGLAQTGLGMLVGATGPLGQAALLRRGLDRDGLVVNAAMMMTFTHLIKILLFGLLGFVLVDYWQIIAGMSVAVIAGTLVGTRLRTRVAEALFRKLLRWLLTLLAARMVIITLW